MPFIRAYKYEMHGDTPDKRCAGPLSRKLQSVAETEDLNQWCRMSVNVSGDSIVKISTICKFIY